MAIYRNININFWTDTKVADDFTPEDKYFMLYCLTNPYTNLCGCYEISTKQMSKDLGYDTETIEKILTRFTEIHKIISYNKTTKELLIKNWHKYNWTKSEKLDKPLLNEIKNIKTPEFKEFVTKLYNNRDTVSIPYLYPIDTTVTDTVTVSVSDTDKNIVDEYEKEIGLLTPYQYERLITYTVDLSQEMIIEAIHIASRMNKKNLAYVEAILKNWIQNGYKVIGDIKNNKPIKDIKKFENDIKSSDLADLYDN